MFWQKVDFNPDIVVEMYFSNHFKGLGLTKLRTLFWIHPSIVHRGHFHHLRRSHAFHSHLLPGSMMLRILVSKELAIYTTNFLISRTWKLFKNLFCEIIRCILLFPYSYMKFDQNKNIKFCCYTLGKAKLFSCMYSNNWMKYLPNKAFFSIFLGYKNKSIWV